MKMKNILLVILVSIIFFSCEKTITLDLKDMQSRIVIEGLVTNAPGKQYVKVTRSADFYATIDEIPAVENATVSVTDDLNNTIVFVHNPNNKPDSAGYYLPENPFTGEIGRTYTLRVDADGKTYTAKDKMFSVTSIDSLGIRINKDEKEDPKEKNKYYEVLVFAKEPQATKDYYLFKFYRNDSIKFDSNNDVYYSDDELLSENIDGVPSPNYYGVGDKATVEAYSLTRDGFVFYSDLSKLINNDGGLFGSPPANCRTNLTNGALGFFQVSALQNRTITITE
jgi:hypothetical protein